MIVFMLNKRVRTDLMGLIDLNNRPGNFLWNRMATPKANYFSWRAVEGKIPAAEELIKRGMYSILALCKVCGRAIESANHVLIQCPYADLIWSYIWLWLKTPAKSKSESVETRLLDMTGFSKKEGQSNKRSLLDKYMGYLEE
ncbi:putative reverse transcriptase zinc-binding domain-containing protein [Helianthus annuus]|nr:putative reverse transcriptase zinc-binding domain-containing protein [Helianthus annuus]